MFCCSPLPSCSPFPALPFPLPFNLPLLEEGQDDKREDGQQREESGVVEESQNKHMSEWR